jgi:prevent-host-death family protein
MTTEALRTVRDHFSDVVDRVESQHERVMVTRNGKPAAVIISPDDVISGVDAVRALRK